MYFQEKRSNSSSKPAHAHFYAFTHRKAYPPRTRMDFYEDFLCSRFINTQAQLNGRVISTPSMISLTFSKGSPPLRWNQPFFDQKRGAGRGQTNQVCGPEPIGRFGETMVLFKRLDSWWIQGDNLIKKKSRAKHCHAHCLHVVIVIWL